MFNNKFPMNPVRNPITDTTYATISIEGLPNPPPPTSQFIIDDLGNFIIDDNVNFIITG